MLSPRVIPCLLMRDGGLVKTVKFKDERYIGDPINAVKIFNEKKSDELILLDIDATVLGREPDYKQIARIANVCRMPLCYGGGVQSVEQVRKIISLGVEKVALSSAVLLRPELVTEIANEFGSQSVVVVLDVKKRFLSSSYDIYTLNGTKKASADLLQFVRRLQELGVGEIVLNSIDQDGVMQGYDLNLIKAVKQEVKVPLTVIGGAGSLEDIKKVVSQFGIIGVSAGSLFVYKGKLRAVLINYPDMKNKEDLVKTQ